MSFRIHQRVKILPHSDVFMMGETRAHITAIGRKWIHVVGERSGRKFKFLVTTDCLEAA